jgi:ribosomal protein S18 acetylase RimI-like enzyme
MGFQIRQVNENDIEGIIRVKHAVWPDTDVNRDLMRRIVKDDGHRTLVAEADGVIAGFVDGFQTVSSDGIRRWELDLIAVHPDFQKRGIAAELMWMNTQSGRERDASLARGLVEIENVGSQRTFIKCGYQSDGQICSLLVREKGTQFSAKAKADQLPPCIITVSTLNYTGLWIEDDWNTDDFRVVNKHLDEGRYELAGCVIPNTNFEAINNAKQAGFKLIGQYQWWKIQF